MTKVFNGRSATDEYMSTHSLTFSTPEMTLKKFALWLGEQVNSPGKGQIPRAMLYIEEKGGKMDSDIAPDVDDTFRPTGAVADMYGDVQQSAAAPTDQRTAPRLIPVNRETLEPESNSSKFCISCGQKLKANAKFCTKCGNIQ
jgi:zinc ribbon protein